MLQAIGEHFPQTTRATRPHGGYFVWLDCARGVDAVRVHEQALAQRISVAPGPIFSTGNRFRNCLRINYGHPWSDAIENAVAELGRLVARSGSDRV